MIDVDELEKRLFAANAALMALADKEPRDVPFSRLVGKAEGVRLAISYLLEMKLEERRG